MNFTLANYPSRSFTDEELLNLQAKGCKFQMNSLESPNDFTSGGWIFNAAGRKYRVAPAPVSNIALFEQLAGITPKKTPRKHAELIKAWAEDDSVVIQILCPDGSWADLVYCSPRWDNHSEYRIKPSEPKVSEQLLKDIQQGLTAGIATCLGMLILKEEV